MKGEQWMLSTLISSKAFDTFFCDRLAEKLRKHGLSKLTEKWTQSWMNFQLQMIVLEI